MTLQEEFHNFIRTSYPNVHRDSAQWRVMEVVWFASALLTSAKVYEEGDNGLEKMSKEAYTKCQLEVRRRKGELREVNSELN